MPRGVTVDEEGVKEAYKNVREDVSENVYVMLSYNEDNTQIGVHKIGDDYSQVSEELGGDVGKTMRAYIYLRVTTGDEMSKRAKFVLLTWCGSEVGAMKKAKMSLEKTEVKKILVNYAVEHQTADLDEMSLSSIVEKVKKSGGANYGTGSA